MYSREVGFIRKLEVWNLVTVGKLVWYISSMSDSMWVRWVHGVYTKGENWRVFNAPITSSWAFKKICTVKDRLGQWGIMDLTPSKKSIMSF